MEDDWEEKMILPRRLGIGGGVIKVSSSKDVEASVCVVCVVRGLSISFRSPVGTFMVVTGECFGDSFIIFIVYVLLIVFF